MLLDGVGIEGIYEAVKSSDHLDSKVAEESFELYDQGLVLSQACILRDGLPRSVFQFIDFLAEKVSPKELYLIIVEKLAWVERLEPGDENISEGGLIYLLFPFNVSTQGQEVWIAKGQLHKDIIVEGLGMVLSSMASILSQQRARSDGLQPSFDVLHVILSFCRGLAMQSKEWSPQITTSNESMWQEDERFVHLCLCFKHRSSFCYSYQIRRTSSSVHDYGS